MTANSRTHRGFTLLELMVTVTIMGVLISYAVPSFTRGVEQSKADVAGGNLRAAWAAQRLYRLDNATYASSLSTLIGAGLLDISNFPDGSELTQRPYAYAFSQPNGDQTFTVTATRNGGAWSGFFTINETGIIGGSPLTDGSVVTITPGFQAFQ